MNRRTALHLGKIDFISPASAIRTGMIAEAGALNPPCQYKQIQYSGCDDSQAYAGTLTVVKNF